MNSSTRKPRSSLIDSGIFVAAYSKRDRYFKEAQAILRKDLGGEFGSLVTSDYVFDEAVTFVQKRTGRHDLARRLGKAIIKSPRLRLEYTDRNLFDKAWGIHDKYDERGLSFTDCILLALMETFEIDLLITLDRDFEGLVHYLNPSK